LWETKQNAQDLTGQIANLFQKLSKTVFPVSGSSGAGYGYAAGIAKERMA
jgi:hypothetical protein